MGAAVATPIGAIGNCFGSCRGISCAACCCRLACSGQVSTSQAVRCILIWLQCFTLAFAVLSAAACESWMPHACERLKEVTVPAGICLCHTQSAASAGVDQGKCLREQSTYRAEAAGTAVFTLLLFCYMGGCRDAASGRYAVGKFTAVVALWFIFLVFPNGAFSLYGTVSTSAAAVFIVMQAVLLIDFAYAWNEAWHAKAEAARQRDLFGRGYRNWLLAILAAAGAMLITAFVIFIALLHVYPRGRLLSIAAVILCIACLITSITAWCEHGNLLASCTITLYITWILSETFTKMSENSKSLFPSWMGLLIFGVSMVALVKNRVAIKSPTDEAADTSHAASTAPSSRHVEDVEENNRRAMPDGDTAANATIAEEAVAELDRWGFALHCGVHVGATVYVAAVLAPARSHAAHVLHAVSVFTVILIYGWTLIAPKVLMERQF